MLDCTDANSRPAPPVALPVVRANVAGARKPAPGAS